MYTIGEISKIVKLSSNALRYYDEIGLFKPMVIQNENQYRFYTDEQIKDIMFIMELKQYGFTLNEIKELMQNKNNQKLKQMLEQKHIELNNEMSRIKNSIFLLEKRISEIIKEDALKMKGGKILIVDDLELARMMIRNIVEEYGYTSIGEASNGEEAIAAYEKLKPDLVIMDVTMPIMDGIDAATIITNKYKDAKIIMCSAMSNTKVILESIKAGARDFVLKPLSSHRLMKAVVRGLDDNYTVDKDIIENIKKLNKEKVLDTILNQEEIDKLINAIYKESENDVNIIDFLNKIDCKHIKNNEHSIMKSTPLEEKILINLEDKFKDISKKLCTYFFSKFGQVSLVKLLTIESITLNEFKTLIGKNGCIGLIEYKKSHTPVYINLYGEFENDQEILNEFLNFIANNLQLNKGNSDIIISSNNLISLNEDYTSVLISLRIEFAHGDKGFMTINIPHTLL